ncbi:MAG: preprotein translocase subunit SecE [Dehalococcoidia bacterium]
MRGIMDEGQTRRRGRLQFFSDVYGELAKVTWPTRQDTARLTVLVLAVAAAMGVFLGLWDYGFSQLFELLFL